MLKKLDETQAIICLVIQSSYEPYLQFTGPLRAEVNKRHSKLQCFQHRSIYQCTHICTEGAGETAHYVKFLLHKHKDLNTQVKISQSALVSILVGAGVRGRQILRDHWSSSLAEPASSSLSKRTCLGFSLECQGPFQTEWTVVPSGATETPSIECSIGLCLGHLSYHNRVCVDISGPNCHQRPYRPMFEATPVAIQVSKSHVASSGAMTILVA